MTGNATAPKPVAPLKIKLHEKAVPTSVTVNELPLCATLTLLPSVHSELVYEKEPLKLGWLNVIVAL